MTEKYYAVVEYSGQRVAVWVRTADSHWSIGYSAPVEPWLADSTIQKLKTEISNNHNQSVVLEHESVLLANKDADVTAGWEYLTKKATNWPILPLELK